MLNQLTCDKSPGISNKTFLLQEVEREISFRTECGLYYSYYKQMLNAPSIKEGTAKIRNLCSNANIGNQSESFWPQFIIEGLIFLLLQ